MQKKILWFDIETVAEVGNFSSYNKKRLWSEKCRDNKFPGLNEEESFYKNAWLYPEFSRVVCISTMINGRTQSFSNRISEGDMLKNFFNYLGEYQDCVLGGFNILTFDIPFLWKRSVILGIKPHKKLCVGDIKPRERNEVDVMQIRKQGSFACSLDLLSISLLGHSPKTGDVNAKNVFEVYYSPRPKEEPLHVDSRLDKIAEYCEKDVEYTKMCYEKIQKSLWNILPVEDPQPAKKTDDDIDHLLPKWAVEIKGDATDKQRNYIKVLRKNVDKYMMVPGFTELLDDYLKAVYWKTLVELDKHQASGLVARLDQIKSDTSPNALAIREVLMPSQPKISDVDDGLPF